MLDNNNQNIGGGGNAATTTSAAQKKPLLGSFDDDVDDESKDFAQRLSNVNNQLSQQKHNDSPKTSTTSTTTTSTTSTSTSTTTTSTTPPENVPTFNDEDYAAELQAEYNKALRVPDVELGLGSEEFDLPESVVSHSSEEYHRFIEIKRSASIIKVISILIMVFSIMTYFSEAWWMIFSLGLLMNPVGFYACHYYKPRLFLAYNFYLVVDIIFRLAFMLANIKILSGFGIFISIAVLLMEGYFVYFCWSFYKRMPRTISTALRQFQSQEASLFPF
ncbi:hypothetical protein SAMD00019534_089700 [Acytostelium subglobosum LB1]|uniref:hypothetical protein n=1 Tax=Acytostelium subglobosum LB1 TaxID=1410327 RepID=UPI00064510D6|nr:hypothetical protein SAMD00019534_089700 [Acytostelium subglobosum LB1]GAM25795.1 hypothetical protein SAMD00019534_089700 [Acytostelium subglobosum LB1]|eukprot:XP_012751313.1 hypothetical protein SAMD00019534_089700 [Acytostelium subglobosum LB1]